MFRITKAFENPITFIYKIEGKVADSSLSEWTKELSTLTSGSGRQVILDFSQVFFISPKALEVLIKKMTDQLYILNCGIEMRNLLHASGMAGRMLE